MKFLNRIKSMLFILSALKLQADKSISYEMVILKEKKNAKFAFDVQNNIWYLYFLGVWKTGLSSR